MEKVGAGSLGQKVHPNERSQSSLAGHAETSGLVLAMAAKLGRVGGRAYMAI